MWKQWLLRDKSYDIPTQSPLTEAVVVAVADRSVIVIVTLVLDAASGVVDVDGPGNAATSERGVIRWLIVYYER